jgi:DNA-binding CsgD family transcriptional regulator
MWDEILRAAELIQAGALSPEGLQAALAAVVDLLGANHAALVAHGVEDGNGLFACAAGLSESELKCLCSPEAMRHAAPIWALAPPGVVVTEPSVISEREWSRSVYYNEWLRPVGGFYGVGFRHTSPTTSLAFASCRPRRAGPFDERAICALRSLLPHLTTAIELHRRLRVAEQGHAGLTHLLGRLNFGVVMTDPLARPLYVNACAARIVAEADGLSLDGSGLTAASPALTRQLGEAIAAVSMDMAVGQRNLCLARPSQRPALLLTLLPVERLGVVLPGMPAPRVAIFIAEPDAPPAIDRAALADAYRLTRRESEVAVLLACGLGLEAIASRLGLGLGTVRNHLKRVFDKTATRSQPSLVALVRGFGEPVSERRGEACLAPTFLRA